MTTVLIVITSIVLIINIIAWLLSKIVIRMDKIEDGQEDVPQDIQQLINEMDEKIRKLEEKEIQTEYDQLKLKVGNLVHKGKNVIVEFYFEKKAVPLVLKCYPKALGIWNPETNTELPFRHMDDFFTADLEWGVNFRRDWPKLRRIKVKTIKKF